MIQSPLLLSAIIAGITALAFLLERRVPFLSKIGASIIVLAMAAVNKWNGLVLPGIIVGLLGYALGNYLGLGIAYLLRGAGVGL